MLRTYTSFWSLLSFEVFQASIFLEFHFREAQIAQYYPFVDLTESDEMNSIIILNFLVAKCELDSL